MTPKQRTHIWDYILIVAQKKIDNHFISHFKSSHYIVLSFFRCLNGGVEGNASAELFE